MSLAADHAELSKLLALREESVAGVANVPEFARKSPAVRQFFIELDRQITTLQNRVVAQATPLDLVTVLRLYSPEALVAYLRNLDLSHLQLLAEEGEEVTKSARKMLKMRMGGAS